MDIANTFDMLSGVSSITRYSQSILSKPENVMEHTGFVALLALAFGKQINAQGTSKTVDIGILLEKALIHDLDEVVTGDVSRPTKYSSKDMQSLFEELSKYSIDQIDRECETNFSEHFAASKESKEGCIVSLCDCLSVLQKAHDEVVMRGNKTINYGDPVGLSELINKRYHEMEIVFHPLSFEKERTESIMLVTQIRKAYTK